MNVKLNYWKSDRVSQAKLDELIIDAMQRRQHRIFDMMKSAEYDEETQNINIAIPRRWLLSNVSESYDVDYEIRTRGIHGVMSDVLHKEVMSHAQQLSRDIVFKVLDFLDMGQSEYVDENIWERIFSE